MKKKCCVIYGNCQERGLDVFLRKSKPFQEQYDIHVFENYAMILGNIPLPVDILKRANLFIYQPLANRHGIYASNHVKSLLSPQCKTISFPYIYNSALWPLFKDDQEMVGKEVIVALMEKGLTLKRILDKFCAGDIDFQFERRFQETMEILRSKEAATDVKVADFIVSNLSTERLFLTQNHPTGTLFFHCVNQILTALDLPRLITPDTIPVNEANLVDCFPDSPYDRAHYDLQDSRHWSVFYPRKKHSNWHRFHFRLILQIYLSCPRPWWAKLFWKGYTDLRIRWSLLTGKGYIKKNTRKETR